MSFWVIRWRVQNSSYGCRFTFDILNQIIFNKIKLWGFLNTFEVSTLVNTSKPPSFMFFNPWFTGLWFALPFTRGVDYSTSAHGSWEGYGWFFFNSSHIVCVRCRFMPIFGSLSWKTQDLGQFCYFDKITWAKSSNFESSVSKLL